MFYLTGQQWIVVLVNTKVDNFSPAAHLQAVVPLLTDAVAGLTGWFCTQFLPLLIVSGGVSTRKEAYLCFLWTS